MGPVHLLGAGGDPYVEGGKSMDTAGTDGGCGHPQSRY